MNISSWNALRVPHSRKLSAKNKTWKFRQIMCNVNWRLIRLTVVLAKQLYHDSFRLSRKRLFALQRRYDSWKGFKITTHQRCSAAWFLQFLLACKKTWKVLCKQVFHKCVDSWTQFVNQNGLNSQLASGLGGSQRSNLNSKYLSGKYPDSFIWVYCVQYA